MEFRNWPGNQAEAVYFPFSLFLRLTVFLTDVRRSVYTGSRDARLSSSEALLPQSILRVRVHEERAAREREREPEEVSGMPRRWGYRLRLALFAYMYSSFLLQRSPLLLVLNAPCFPILVHRYSR